MLTIRPETGDDGRAIHTVHVAAFPTDAEARLVDTLRANGKAFVSLVAESEGRVVGHVLFSPVCLDSPGGVVGAGLAPLAVLPSHQRKGVGGKLVASGIEACRCSGFGFVVVLGEPTYYQRFGFKRARSYNLDNEYGADEEFMVLELQSGSLNGLRGVVRYGPEFSIVESRSP
jgi:putative acetyltransferase